MVRHTISVPEPMSQYIESQIHSGQYGNISEYFRDLVRRDQERKQLAIEQLRHMLDEAEASGMSERNLDDIWQAAKKRALQ